MNMRINWDKVIARLVVVLCLLGAAMLLTFLAGCADSREGRRDMHRIERKQTFVVIPATESAPAQVVPVVEITETQEGETSASTGKSGPDWQQIQPVAQAIGAAAGGLGWGHVTGGVLALATATATAWIARGKEVASEKKRADFHEKDAAEAYEKLLPTTAKT
jgi:hypothetical protein